MQLHLGDGHSNARSLNASLYGDVQVTRELGITGKLGAKTPGYMMGLPIDAGLHGYLGISLAMF